MSHICVTVAREGDGMTFTGWIRAEALMPNGGVLVDEDEPADRYVILEVRDGISLRTLATSNLPKWDHLRRAQ